LGIVEPGTHGIPRLTGNELNTKVAGGEQKLLIVDRGPIANILAKGESVGTARSRILGTSLSSVGRVPRHILEILRVGLGLD
jgi:hypothetical protein